MMIFRGSTKLGKYNRVTLDQLYYPFVNVSLFTLLIIHSFDRTVFMSIKQTLDTLAIDSA